MTTGIKKELIFISPEEAKQKEAELERISTEEIFLQPELGETRTIQEQYEERLQTRLDELDADLVQAPRRFIEGETHTAIFYKDVLRVNRALVYSGKIPC